MFPGWQSNSRSNVFTFTMSSLYYLDLICVSAFWRQSNRSAHASVSGRVTLIESEQEIAFISDFVRVFDMSLQQYLPIITNESEHRFINPQAKEPTLSKNILIFGWIRHVPCWGGSLFLMFMFFCCSDASALYYSREKLVALTRDLRFLPPALTESSNS